MKKIIFITLTLLFTFSSFVCQESQEMTNTSFEKVNKANYGLGSGVSLNFDDSTHIFNIGGMVQPRFLNTTIGDSGQDSKNYFQCGKPLKSIFLWQPPENHFFVATP